MGRFDGTAKRKALVWSGYKGTFFVHQNRFFKGIWLTLCPKILLCGIIGEAKAKLRGDLPFKTAFVGLALAAKGGFIREEGHLAVGTYLANNSGSVFFLPLGAFAKMPDENCDLVPPLEG